MSLTPQLLAVVSTCPGASTLGTELATLNSMIEPMHGSVATPASAWASVTAPDGPRPSSRIVSSVDQLDPVADPEPGEVDDDIVALGHALLVQRGEQDRVHQQVAVVGDLPDGNGVAARIREGQLPVPRHASNEDAEAVLARQHLHDRRIGEVDERDVAVEAVGGEDVEEVLAVLVGGAVGDDEVHIEIDVAVVEELAAGQPQVDTVDELLVAPIRTAVVVHHAEIALVDILGGEEEAVIVRPHGALDLTEVARHVDKTAVPVRSGRSAIRGSGIDLVAPRQRRAPAIVVEGAGEVMGAGGAVALGAVVGVVEVQLRLVAAEADALSSRLTGVLL